MSENRGVGVVQVAVDGTDAIMRAENLLAGVQGGMQKALGSAAKRAAAKIRTANVKAVRERYATSAANVRENENVQVSYSYTNGVQASVRFAGRRIPLYRFDGATPSQPKKDTSEKVPVMIGDGKWRLLNPSVPAAGHALKGTSPTQLESAFVARMPNGHVGIFEQTGGMSSGNKGELRELTGPAVPQMLGNETVVETLAGDAMKDFEKDLDHSVMAILSGYMG